MLFRQLKYFIAVVEANSFTEAAEQCFISQSAISQQIKALEQELGVELLQRGNRKFTLTPAGSLFYQKGRALLEDARRLCQEVTALAQEQAQRLRIGYLKCYSGLEFQMAVAEFSQQYPEAAVEIMDGNHEDLYDALRLGRLDIILSDQRRAFSDRYVNRILAASACNIEISQRHPLAERESLSAAELRSLPCILVASPAQRETEEAYYRDIVGLEGEFLFADNLEQARLLVMGTKGYLPVEGSPNPYMAAPLLCRLPLLRDGKPILRNYCAFWKVENEAPLTKAFAEILARNFEAPQELIS